VCAQDVYFFYLQLFDTKEELQPENNTENLRPINTTKRYDNGIWLQTIEKNKVATLCAGWFGLFMCGHWTSQIEKDIHMDKILLQMVR